MPRWCRRRCTRTCRREVHVYAPVGLDLVDYLTRIARFNTRAEAPTPWSSISMPAPDFLDRMAGEERRRDRAIFAGRNQRQDRLIEAAIEAGLHVLADKPMIIRRADLPALAAVLDAAAEAQGLVLPT